MNEVPHPSQSSRPPRSPVPPPSPDGRAPEPGGDRPRLGANLLWLVPGVVGGSEDYTVRLLDSFARVADGGSQLTLFVNRSFPAAHPGLVQSYPTVLAPVSGSNKALRVGAEASWLAHRAKAEGVDLLHHMGGNLLRARPPGIVTIHDLQPFAHPEHFSRRKGGYLGLTVPSALRRSVLVITLTEHARQDVHERMGIPHDDILLVPPGVDQVTDPPAPDELARVRQAYDIGSRPYFVYPAITYPHKNHLTLVRAFAQVAASHPDPLLVLTGGTAQAEEPLRAEIEALRLDDRVRRLGRIPRRDLDVLISGAVALTFPSTYEGFGIPVLEAMSRHCPVIASTATALPEVVGSAGILVDPFDVDGWTAALDQLLDDPGRRAGLAELGFERAGQFSWERSVGALVRAYQVAWAAAGSRGEAR
jgi:glycosyltransferase involved in cell wall biosynthesis